MYVSWKKTDSTSYLESIIIGNGKCSCSGKSHGPSWAIRGDLFNATIGVVLRFPLVHMESLTGWLAENGSPDRRKFVSLHTANQTIWGEKGHGGFVFRGHNNGLVAMHGIYRLWWNPGKSCQKSKSPSQSNNFIFLEFHPQALAILSVNRKCQVPGLKCVPMVWGHRCWR